MRCIVCDCCKAIIEDPKKARVILCSRPLKPAVNNPRTFSSDDKQANEILWEKDVCMKCADKIERFADMDSGSPDTPDDGGDAPGTTDPDTPQPDQPDPGEEENGDGSKDGNKGNLFI